MNPIPLILASASPRRVELLRRLTPDFQVDPSAPAQGEQAGPGDPPLSGSPGWGGRVCVLGGGGGSVSWGGGSGGVGGGRRGGGGGFLLVEALGIVRWWRLGRW